MILKKQKRTKTLIHLTFKVTSVEVVTTTGTTTTEEIVTVTPRQVTPSVCEWKNFVYGPGDSIENYVLKKSVVPSDN